MLTTDQISDLERGVDAAVETILLMARQATVHIATNHGKAVAGPLIGFIDALVDDREGLSNRALELALMRHPQLGTAEVGQEPQP